MTLPRALHYEGLIRALGTPRELGVACCQCSQNVDVNSPHHRPYQLMASSSLNCHWLVE